MKNKIYTKCSLWANENKFTEFSGEITEKEFVMIWDFLEIIWQPSFDSEFKRASKKAYKEIEKIIDKFNLEID